MEDTHVCVYIYTHTSIPYGNLSSIPTTWSESQIPSLTITKITNLQTALDGKAPTSHSHTRTDITTYTPC